MSTSDSIVPEFEDNLNDTINDADDLYLIFSSFYFK